MACKYPSLLSEDRLRDCARVVRQLTPLDSDARNTPAVRSLSDAGIESRLSLAALDACKSAFDASQRMNYSEFGHTIRRILGDASITDVAVKRFCIKVDVHRTGSIGWTDLCAHMAYDLSQRANADRNELPIFFASTLLPTWHRAELRYARVTGLPPKVITVDTAGRLVVWSMQLEPQRTLDIRLDASQEGQGSTSGSRTGASPTASNAGSPRKQGNAALLNIQHVCIFHCAHVVVAALSNRTLAFFDVGTGHQRIAMTSLPDTVTCIEEARVVDSRPAVVWGDAAGALNMLVYPPNMSASTSLAPGLHSDGSSQSYVSLSSLSEARVGSPPLNRRQAPAQQSSPSKAPTSTTSTAGSTSPSKTASPGKEGFVRVQNHTFGPDDMDMSVKQLISQSHSDHHVIVTCAESSQASVCLRDVRAFFSPRIFSMPKGCCRCALSLELNLLATGSPDGTVRLWNPFITSMPLAVFDHATKPIISLGFDDPHELILAASADGSVRAWHTDTQAIVKYLPNALQERPGRFVPLKAASFHEASCSFLAGRGEFLALAQAAPADTDDGDDKGACQPSDAATEGSSLPDQTSSGSQQRAVSPATLHQRLRPAHRGRVTSLVYFPHLATLATSSTDGSIRTWSIELAEDVDVPLHASPALECSAAHYGSIVTALAADGRPGGVRLFSAAEDGSMMARNVASGAVMYSLTANHSVLSPIPSAPLQDKPRRRRGSPSSSPTPFLQTRDGENNRPTNFNSRDGGQQDISCLLARRHRVVALGFSGSFRLFDLSLADSLSPPPDKVPESPSWRPTTRIRDDFTAASLLNDSVLATGDSSGYVRVWNLLLMKATGSFKAVPDQHTCNGQTSLSVAAVEWIRARKQASSDTKGAGSQPRHSSAADLVCAAGSQLTFWSAMGQAVFRGALDVTGNARHRITCLALNEAGTLAVAGTTTGSVVCINISSAYQGSTDTATPGLLKSQTANAPTVLRRFSLINNDPLACICFIHATGFVAGTSSGHVAAMTSLSDTHATFFDASDGPGTRIEVEEEEEEEQGESRPHAGQRRRSSGAKWMLTRTHSDPEMDAPPDAGALSDPVPTIAEAAHENETTCKAVHADEVQSETQGFDHDNGAAGFSPAQKSPRGGMLGSLISDKLAADRSARQQARQQRIRQSQASSIGDGREAGMVSLSTAPHRALGIVDLEPSLRPREPSAVARSRRQQQVTP